MSNNIIDLLPTDTVSVELGAGFDFKRHSSSSESLSGKGAYASDIGKLTDGNQPMSFVHFICFMIALPRVIPITPTLKTSLKRETSSYINYHTSSPLTSHVPS